MVALYQNTGNNSVITSIRYKTNIQLIVNTLTMQVDEFVFKRQMMLMQYHGAKIYHIDQGRIMML